MIQATLVRVEVAAGRLEEAASKDRKEPENGGSLRTKLAVSLIEAFPEFLKYPVMGASVILLLLGAKSCLNIPIDRIAKIGPEGIEFNVETQRKFLELNLSKEDLEKRLAAVEHQKVAMASRATSPATRAPAPAGMMPSAPAREEEDVESQVQQEEQLQTTSDATAQLAVWRADGAQPALMLRQKSGFLFLGGFRDGQWRRLLIRPQDARATPAPEAIAAGDGFAVASNIILRDRMPSAEQRFPRGIGVLPVGTRVKAVGPAVSIERGPWKAWWLEVEVLDRTATFTTQTP